MFSVETQPKVQNCSKSIEFFSVFFYILESCFVDCFFESANSKNFQVFKFWVKNSKKKKKAKSTLIVVESQILLK